MTVDDQNVDVDKVHPGPTGEGCGWGQMLLAMRLLTLAPGRRSQTLVAVSCYSEHVQ